MYHILYENLPRPIRQNEQDTDQPTPPPVFISQPRKMPPSYDGLRSAQEMVPEYDGNPATLTDFLKKARNAARKYRLDDVDTLELITSKLTRQAKAWLTIQIGAREPLDRWQSFDAFKQDLQAKFGYSASRATVERVAGLR